MGVLDPPAPRTDSGHRWPDSPVICDDHSWGERGLQGWTQLHDSTLGWYPPLGIEPLGHGGGAYLTLISKNGTSAREMSTCAIKRLYHIASVYDLEVWWAWRTPYTINGTRSIDFGLDNATRDGTRHFLKFRWAHYTSTNRDGSGTWSRTNTLQVVDSDGFYTDFPGSPTFPAAINENKADMNYFRGRFDVPNAQYVGAIFNSDGYGCFSDGAGGVDHTGSGDDTAFRAFATGPPSPAASFAYGLNPTVEMAGRVDTALNDAVLNVDRVRLSVVA